MPSVIGDLLDSLHDADRELTSEEKKRAELSELTNEDKEAQAFEWKMTGVPVQNIALAFGVDRSTIYRWLSQHADRYRQSLEQESGANLVAGSLQFLDRIEELCLHEADQLTGEGSSIDPKTGEVTHRTSNNTKAMKHKFINSALKARGMKMDLLLQTGIMPKEPERIYHKMEDEKRDAGKRDDDTTKTKDELLADIAQLLEKGTRI